MQKTILSTALLLGCLSLHAQRVLTLEQCRDAAINHNIAVRSANRSLEKVQKQIGCPVRCSEKQRLISPVELLI